MKEEVGMKTSMFRYGRRHPSPRDTRPNNRPDNQPSNQLEPAHSQPEPQPLMQNDDGTSRVASGVEEWPGETSALVRPVYRHSGVPGQEQDVAGNGIMTFLVVAAVVAFVAFLLLT